MNKCEICGKEHEAGHEFDWDCLVPDYDARAPRECNACNKIHYPHCPACDSCNAYKKILEPKKS